MAWDGYFEYDGNEIINVSRLESYVRSAGHDWFRPVYENEVLPFMLGHGSRYISPLMDDAPWTDPDIPESFDFYGLYPLDVTGIEDSSRSSSVVESLGEGGVAGRLRHGTKSVVFNTILLAGNDAGAEYGIQWLKRALLGSACGVTSGSICNGADLCYLSSSPDMDLPDASAVAALLDGGHFVNLDVPVQIETDDPDLDGGSPTGLPNYQFDGGTVGQTVGLVTTKNVYPFNFTPDGSVLNSMECLEPLLRTFRKVVFNSGPQVTAKRETTDGAAVWTVQFTAVAGSPYQLGAEVPVIEGLLDPDVPVPWAGGEEPEGGLIDLDGFIFPETKCVETVYDPIYDPKYPAVVAPPTPPSIPLGFYQPPVNWRRRQFTIPRQYVPSWGEVVPKVEVHARAADLRNLRLRFYSDPFSIGDISDDPCAYCGDIVISYVPKDHTMVLDGSEEAVYVIAPGGIRRRAESLVFRTDGTPFDWPTLTCGFGFIVTLDLPQTQKPPVVDLSLFPRAV